MQREPPMTAEGWYALHDLRRIDWDGWRDASTAVRERAIEEGEAFLSDAEAISDAEAGQSAVYSIQGHGADLLILHLRPAMADLDALERRFETTAFAEFTERADSFVSVTEASGYSERAREYFEGDLDPDSGLAKYIRSRLHPEIPDEEFVSFYPMEKRREPEQNWYDLPFAERAEHIERHGNIGRNYGGKVTQMITGAMGMDDWEWGVTLWAGDLIDVKRLLAEMRFDQSTSKFAEFGTFYVGRRIVPDDLEALLAGERIESGTGDSSAQGSPSGESAAPGPSADGTGGHPGDTGTTVDHSTNDVSEASDAEGASDHGGGPPSTGEFTEVDDAAQRLGVLGVQEGEDYESGDYGLVFYANADAEDLADDVADLRESFDHYDRHVLTSLRAGGGRAAVVSVWEAKEAAEIAAGFIDDLPPIAERYGGQLGEPTEDEGDAGESDDEASGDASDDASDGSDEAADPAAAIREELADLDVYAGQPHGEDVYALVLYSRADDELVDAVSDLQESFAEADGHVKTALYDDPNSETTAVVSLWNSAESADEAGPTLADLPDVVGRPDDGDGFTTMGMFYTVKPEHREDFVETFETVGEILEEMDGHRETALLVNRDAENDMFIASRWDAKEDAMAFFRSDDFAETVQWGRDVLAGRPRHVFLA